MSTAPTVHEARYARDSIVSVTGSIEALVDELADADVARYLSLRALAQAVRDAAREAESRARLEIALVLQSRAASVAARSVGGSLRTA